MKNKLVDVHNSLMMSLEMLDDDELFDDAEKSAVLLERVKAKVNIAKQIVEVDRLGLDAMKFSEENAIALPSSFRLSNKGANNEQKTIGMD